MVTITNRKGRHAVPLGARGAPLVLTGHSLSDAMSFAPPAVSRCRGWLIC
jgi:hypothetical protein